MTCRGTTSSETPAENRVLGKLSLTERFILWIEIMAMIHVSAKHFPELITLLIK